VFTGLQGWRLGGGQGQPDDVPLSGG
jgi:hypothetical protein